MLLALTEAVRGKVPVAPEDRFRGGYVGPQLTSGLDDPESLFQA